MQRSPVALGRRKQAKPWDHEPGLPGRDVLHPIEAEAADEGAGTIGRSWVRSATELDDARWVAIGARARDGAGADSAVPVSPVGSCARSVSVVGQQPVASRRR